MIDCIQVIPDTKPVTLEDEGTIIYVENPKLHMKPTEINKLKEHIDTIKILDKDNIIDIPNVYSINKQVKNKIKRAKLVKFTSWLAEAYAKVKHHVSYEVFVVPIMSDYLIRTGDFSDYADIPRTLCILHDISFILRNTNSVHRRIYKLLSFIGSTKYMNNSLARYSNYVFNEFRTKYPVCCELLHIKPMTIFSFDDDRDKKLAEQIRRILQREPI